jgi:hypothetical protein
VAGVVGAVDVATAEVVLLEGWMDEGATLVAKLVDVEDTIVVATTVEVTEVLVDTDVLAETPAVEDKVAEAVEPLRVRYQFDLSVSPRHSPTVTPFQPLALIKSK